MRAFVTGAGGLLGKALLEQLDEANADAVALYRDINVVFDYATNTPVMGDVRDERLMERVIRQYEITHVFHLASQTQVIVANESPLETLDANVRGTWSVLEACRRAGRGTRFILASSDKVYAGQKPPYVEEMPLSPLGPYDTSKVMAEEVAWNYHRFYGVPVTVVRCSNLYGPCDLNWRRILPATMRFAFRGEPLVLRGGGRMKRDYLHVNDAARAYLRASESDGIGEAFNFGTSEPVELREFVGKALAVAGCKREPDVRDQAKGEIFDQWMDCSKAYARLGWKPLKTLDEGLRTTVDWYRSHLA